jgi:hypothetical protein
MQRSPDTGRNTSACVNLHLFGTSFRVNYLQRISDVLIYMCLCLSHLRMRKEVASSTGKRSAADGAMCLSVSRDDETQPVRRKESSRVL